MKYCRADKGGAMVYASVVFLIRQALLHVSDRAAYQEPPTPKLKLGEYVAFSIALFLYTHIHKPMPPPPSAH